MLPAVICHICVGSSWQSSGHPPSASSERDGTGGPADAMMVAMVPVTRLYADRDGHARFEDAAYFGFDPATAQEYPDGHRVEVYWEPPFFREA